MYQYNEHFSLRKHIYLITNPFLLNRWSNGPISLLFMPVKIQFSGKGEHGAFYYVLEKDIDQIILVVGDMFICYECVVIICQMI